MWSVRNEAFAVKLRFFCRKPRENEFFWRRSTFRHTNTRRRSCPWTMSNIIHLDFFFKDVTFIRTECEFGSPELCSLFAALILAFSRYLLQKIKNKSQVMRWWISELIPSDPVSFGSGVGTSAGSPPRYGRWIIDDPRPWLINLRKYSRPPPRIIRAVASVRFRRFPAAPRLKLDQLGRISSR